MGEYRNKYDVINSMLYNEDGEFIECDSHEDERDAYESAYDNLCGLCEQLLDVMENDNGN